jgi:small subunit ribosomal protein S9
MVVNPYTWGTGRRKTAVARVRIKPGTGKVLVNQRALEHFFPNLQDRIAVQAPLRITGAESTYDIWVNVRGGGPTGQSGAVLLGLARALMHHNPAFEPALREHSLLTRDSRMKERKKYGQRGARRRFQFSKR